MATSVMVGWFAHCAEHRASADFAESVSVWEERFDRLNEAMRAADLPEHHEPRSLQGKDFFSFRMATGDFLRLGRLALYARLPMLQYDDFGSFADTGDWPPPCPDTWPIPDLAALEAEYFESSGTEGLFSQLYWHSDHSGFYVPIEFEDPILPYEDDDRAGGPIGSTQVLLADCKALATCLGLPLDLCPAEIGEHSKTFNDIVATNPGPGWWNYPAECVCCLNLLAACRKSLKLKAAIVFSG